MGRGQRGSYVTGEEVSGIETPCVRGAVKAIESVLDYRYSEHGEGGCGSVIQAMICNTSHCVTSTCVDWLILPLPFKVTLQDFRTEGYSVTTADSYRTCKLPAFVCRCDLGHLLGTDAYVNRCFLF